METLDVINRRRSCKNYIPDKRVPGDIIEKICDAGRHAATGMNRQSPKIIVINNKELRDKLEKLNAAVLGAEDGTFYNAPQVIVVLANREVPTYIYDGTIVMANMLIAAEALNVGACWIHRAKEVFASEEGKKILAEAGIEGEWEGIGNLIVGYPAGERRKDIELKEDYVQWIN